MMMVEKTPGMLGKRRSHFSLNFDLMDTDLRRLWILG